MLQSRAHWLRHVMGDPAALRARMTASLARSLLRCSGGALEKFPPRLAAAAQALPMVGTSMRGRGSSRLEAPH